jgi:hypothetical protein
MAWKTARFRAVQVDLYGSTATIYKFQIPPDLVVKSQAIDIIGLILSLIQ